MGLEVQNATVPERLVFGVSLTKTMLAARTVRAALFVTEPQVPETSTE